MPRREKRKKILVPNFIAAEYGEGCYRGKRDFEYAEEEESNKKIPVIRAASVAASRTKLHHAVLNEKSRIVQSILKSQPNLIDVKDREGNTALHLAAKYGLDGLKMLLAAHANTRLQNIEGFTPLHCALIANKTDAALVLLKYDGKIDLQDFWGRTPLHVATEQEQLSIMRGLIQAGVDTSLQEQRGRTPLHCALYMAKERAARMLANSVRDINIKDKKGKSPLHVAARAGFVGIMKILLARGGDISLLCRDEWTPLHDAARGGCVEMVQILLSEGSDTRLQEESGHTPLLIALMWGLEGAAEALVEIDGENNLPNRFDCTPLKEAVRRDFSGIVRRLLFCGVLPPFRSTGISYSGWAFEKVSAAEMILPMVALEGIALDWENLQPWHVPSEETVPYYREFLEECQAEIQQMKKAKVLGTKFSYYDLAKRHLSEVERYLGNEDVQKHWRDKVQDFPHYADLIDFKVRRAKERRILSARCVECLSFLSPKLPSLSHVSIRIILAQLCERDMQHFLTAVPSRNSPRKRKRPLV